MRLRSGFEVRGYLWEINGTDGDLVVTLDSPPVIQLTKATLRGGRGDEVALTELPLPRAYERVPAYVGRQDEMAYNLAHAYAQLYHDLRNGTQLTPDFAHVRLHHLLDRIEGES